VGLAGGVGLDGGVRLAGGGVGIVGAGVSEPPTFLLTQRFNSAS
jgi:hypothetical protein